MNGRPISPFRRRNAGAPTLWLTALWLAVFLLGACAPAEPPATPVAPPAPEVAPPAPEPPPEPSPPVLLDRHGRLIVEAMEYPWSALGRLNTGGRGFCTGILIGPRLVLSRAHCLHYGVEGRWRAPNELHFVAGYQRDAYVIHAGVAGYEVAPVFTRGAANSLAKMAGDWALVALDAPIGLRAGWLALQRLDPGTRARLTLGEGLALQAGYRRGWAHSLTVKLGCLDRWQAAKNSGGGRDGPCAEAPANPELPVLLFLDGEVRALANPMLLARAEAGRIAEPEFRALVRRGSTWGESRAPNGGSPAAQTPADTVARLLLHLGYLDWTGRSGDKGGDGKAQDAAIRSAERAHGLPQSGRPSPALLERLLLAARRNFLPPPKVSWAGPERGRRRN